MMVAIVGGLLVFLLGCCLVMLAAIHRRLTGVGAAIVGELQRAARERRDTVQQFLHGSPGSREEPEDERPSDPPPSWRPPVSSRAPISSRARVAQLRPTAVPSASAASSGAPTLKSGRAPLGLAVEEDAP